MNLKTIQEKAEYYSFLHKQNLNGRESEDELFELGIQVGIEETEQLQDEFAIEFAEWLSMFTQEFQDGDLRYWNKDKWERKSLEELLETFKKEKGL